MDRFLVSSFIGLAIVIGAMLLIVLLTKVFGDQCWAPRVGGLLVGFAVFAQGYLYANIENFQRKLRSGITVEQRIMHAVYVASVLGTFLWALGDFIPSVFGVPVCKK